MSDSTKKVKYRIGWFSGTVLVIFAVLSDLLELVADLVGVGIAGWLVDIIEFLVIVPLFFVNRVKILGAKEGGKWLTTVVVGLIPVISPLLPETIIGVLSIIRSSRKEDEAKSLGKKENPNPNITRTKRVREKIRG